ncbi:uncharacterized protein LOC119562709 isoform X2 [Drosophila subpulchrella]|uniref:uncharacterized protein LOC119562709 isoform X2 n=1 Tax=Drosophila subpulchrella TaxID=1486046 RepID=UPI0018A1915D|nr:uncharacterized protein LOC119562709 isoform X2 [Drosophila subpulchrella]
MGTYPQTVKLLFLLCLAIALLVPPGTTGVGQEDSPISVGLLHRSKRTMTTICAEITPGGSQDEPYYMCRGANFGGENGQNCVKVRNQGGQGEPFYMCRGPNPGLSPAINSHYAIQHDSVHNFPSVPALEVGSTSHQAVSEDHIQQDQPAGSTSYQKKPHYPHLPQQHQPHAHSRFYGSHLAAPSSVDSPPVASPGISTGPARSSNHPNNKEMVGHSRHQFNFKGDVLAVPNLGFQQDELNQELCRPENQPYPEDQLMWVSLSHTQGPENDPVMKAFYSSLTSAGAMAPADNQPVSVPLEPIGKMASGYSHFDSQYPGASAPATLSSPPSTYSQAELSADPNQHCSGHSASVPPFQCLTQPNIGVSLRTSCPNLQPVIITMPCYGQRQPTPYIALPRTPPGIVRSKTKAIPFGLDKGPMVSPFGGGFGLGSQFGSPFGMNQIGTEEYDMEHQNPRSAGSQCSSAQSLSAGTQF